MKGRTKARKSQKAGKTEESAWEGKGTIFQGDGVVFLLGRSGRAREEPM